MTDQELKDYFVGAIASFITDQPDSDYQRGYLGALMTAAQELCGVTDTRKAALDYLKREKRSALHVFPGERS